jgi:hypothetical protein
MSLTLPDEFNSAKSCKRALPLACYGLWEIRANGTQPIYELDLGEDNYAIFATAAAAQPFSRDSVLSGLVHVPAASAIGAGWVCPGVDAVWAPVSRAECQKGHCSYILSMPNASLLSCTASTQGTLDLFRTSVRLWLASSNTANLNGAEFGFASFRYSASRPGRIAFAESTVSPLGQFLKIIFDGTPVSTNTALAPQDKAWTLSNVALVHNPTGLAGPIELMCASDGTLAPNGAWPDTPTVPLQPTVSVTGMSLPVTCPGTPLATPVTILFNEVPKFD